MGPQSSTVVKSGRAAWLSARRTSRWRAGGGFALAVVSLTTLYLWSYGDCIGAFFHFDDFWVLADAADVRLQSPLDVVRFFEPKQGFVLYRPISTVLYFYVLHQFFGYDPTGYHATQIAFHIANALLAYGIADCLFFSRPLALGTALVYASAPGHAIAACWNALFTETGTAFFYFLGLYLWLRLNSRWRVPVTLVVFSVALLAGEHAVSFPMALTLAAILLHSQCDWRRVVREQAVFYLVGGSYAAAKLFYLHFLLDKAFPSPVAAAYRAGYGMSFQPQLVLQHLGRYFGFTVNLLYTVAAQNSWALVFGLLVIALAAVSTACVLSGRWATLPLRVAAFGLDLFIVALGPVLALQSHLYSYYVGIAALGMALALIGFAGALPRLSAVPVSLVVATLLTAHLLWAAKLVRQSNEFVFFNSFSRAAAGWLYTLTLTTQLEHTEEAVVPRTGLTALVFDEGQAQRLFLCASYRVRTTGNIDEEVPASGRVILRQPVPLVLLPRSWTWMRRACER